MTDHPEHAVIHHVVQQHAEEAAFLWMLRDEAALAPHYTSADLTGLDGRLDAHIDGLRIAGDAGWEICQQELAWEEAGEVFAGAMLAFENGRDGRTETILEIAAKSADLARGAISALGWLEWDRARPFSERLMGADQPILRRVGIAAAAVQRQDPGKALGEALADEPIVRARALRAVGELGRRDLLPVCLQELRSDDAECRFWGAWSAALLGEDAGIAALKETAEAAGDRAERAADLAARRMDPSDALAWQRQLAGREEARRLAIVVAGALGDPALVPWLLEQMPIDELARPAGEALSFITGIDLAYDDLEGEWPEGFAAGPTEEPEDENVEMDPDEDLPWPDPELIKGWWEETQGNFRSGTRHLLGKPMTEGSLQEALRVGRQRQRAVAALELAIRSPGGLLFEVRAPGFRQKRQLGL